MLNQLDLVKHFNMGRCTVTIDTQATGNTTHKFPGVL